MVAVEGSKQHRMVVVPYRPWYRASIIAALTVLMGMAVWSSYQYGLGQGLDLRAEVVEERGILKRQVEERELQIENMRQEIAHLKVGEEVDSRATEEVRQTVESLQTQIAELEEEIQFYKGVMLPNVEQKGLRIERFRLTKTDEPGRVRYNLLLTQVVDEHEFIQGGVSINVTGTQDGDDLTLSLAEITAQDRDTRGFKFRYFQNIDGEFIFPEGFEPGVVNVTAQSSGGNSRKRGKSFPWQPSGG
ncbi:MAG: DUF6776 family protein [Pseudomonadales bacterium]